MNSADILKLFIEDYLKNKIRKIINLALMINLFESDKYQQFLKGKIDNNKIPPREFILKKSNINYQKIATILAEFIFNQYAIKIPETSDKLPENIKELIVI